VSNLLMIVMPDRMRH